MLFKYLSSERVDVLENLKIRFSPLMSLNDPFECQPLVDIRSERSQFLEKTLQDLDRLWEKTDISEKTEENRKIFEGTRGKLVVDINENMSSFVIGQELMSLLSDNFGVLSLSRTEDNLLMWSHYTGEGKGIVLGLNDDHEFFKQPDLSGRSTRPTPVVYTDKRRMIVPGEDRFYEKLFCEKPRDWAYEEEERLFRTFLFKDGDFGKDAYDMDVILTALPKEVIKAVYLGYRISESTKNRVLSAIQKNKIFCKVYQAKVSRVEYKIEFDEQIFT